MSRGALSDYQVKCRVRSGLRSALVQFRPGAHIDANGYAPSYRDNLLPRVDPADFEAELRAGDGNELGTKFRAAHSSSALAVNCFAPFRARITDLTLEPAGPFKMLQFERKCPTGLRGARAPNLDVVISGQAGVAGIESKLTEHMAKHKARFSPAYKAQIRDGRREQGYFREMLRLMQTPDAYCHLDAAQLIKHAFGLARTFPDVPVTLLYLYWEPLNWQRSKIFVRHRKEIAAFASRVSGATPEFQAMPYPDLWKTWRKNAPQWLTSHLENLKSRYLITL